MAETKFLITGGAGFIGSHIARRLVERGIPTVIQDSFVQYFSPLDPEWRVYQAYIEARFGDIRGKVPIVRGDTRNKDDMRRLVSEHRPTHIIHLAALPLASLSTSFSEEAVGSILTGTINLLEIIRDLDCVERFVYTSSSMVYGDFEYIPADEEHPKRPKDIYGGAKLCGEIMTEVYGRRLGIEYTIVRPSAVYGPTDVNRRVSQIFVENALRGKPLILKGGGETALDFTFIEDVAEGMVLAALQPGGKNEVFNMTRGEGRSLLEFAEILSRMIPGVEVVVEPADAHNPKRGALDISKARRLLGYSPKYSLEEGLKTYVDFVRAHMGGSVKEERQVPLCRPSIGPQEIETVVQVLRSGWLAHGEYNHKLEESFAQLIGVPHAISLNSCTSALELALRVSGIGGEVIVPSMTFVATANAVVTSGATPVFCEVDGATRNVTAGTIAERITPRTEAIIIVHYGGQPCQMDEIVRLCEQHHLLLIEDSAETLGATWRGRQAGSFGIGCFSFFPTKNITTGEGGMLTCRDDEFAREVRMLIAHGITSTTMARERSERPWLRAAEIAGHNYRMANPLAALGYSQLLRLEEMNHKRQALARRYDNLLAGLSPPVWPPAVVDGATHVYQMYTIEVGDGMRDAVLHYLRAHGVGASVHFDPPVHLQPYYLGLGNGPGTLPVTERLAGELITLPIYPDMTEPDQDWVVKCLGDALEEVAA